MKKIFFIFLLFIILKTNAFSSELVFEFTNPSFGGNPLYGSYLLQQAEMQNMFKEEPSAYQPRSIVESFEETLLRQILNRLAYKIVEQAFGEEGLEEGTYYIGEYIIEVTPQADVIRVEIINTATGGDTIIEVPYY